VRPDDCDDGHGFVAELGGRGNVAQIERAVRAELDARWYEAGHPWYFPSIGECAPRLETNGLEAVLVDPETEMWTADYRRLRFVAEPRQ